MLIKRFYEVLPVLILFAACSNDRPARSASGRLTIQSFHFTIRNSGVIKSEMYETTITEKHIRVVQGEGDDTLQFITPLLYSDTLNRISEISLSALDSLYSNDCIADGLQLTAVLRKEDSIKTVHISNFYQPDIGLAIEYINSYVPEKFRIVYDRKQLEEEYNKCKELDKKLPS